VRTCFPQAFLNCELVAASWSELRGVLALLVVSALPVDGSRKPMETMPRLVVFFFARSLLTENPLGSACWEGGVHCSRSELWCFVGCWWRIRRELSVSSSRAATCTAQLFRVGTGIARCFSVAGDRLRL
jgi:hypothetical protein